MFGSYMQFDENLVHSPAFSLLKIKCFVSYGTLIYHSWKNVYLDLSNGYSNFVQCSMNERSLGISNY